MTAQRSLVRELWTRRVCLGASGIHRPDDTVTLVSFKRIDDSGLVVAERTALRNAAEFDEDDVIELDDVDPVQGPGGVLVFAGGTGWGSEGYVAVCEADEELRWLAVFDSANPFVLESVAAGANGELQIRSTYGALWRFPPNDPEGVVVERGEFGWGVV
jgi:hypothetical protein